MQVKLQSLLARTSPAFASATRGWGSFAAVKSFGLFSFVLVLCLLMSFQALAVPAPTVTSFTPTSGPAAGGTTVTVTGTNFTIGTGNNTATVNGVAATSVIATSATQLTLVTAAGTGSGLIIVTTGGKSNSTSPTFTYAGVPTVTSFTPTSGPVSGGTTVTVTGTNFVSSGLSATVAGVAATAVTYVSATQITLVTPAGAAGTSGPISVTTIGGTGTSSGNFTYLAAPTISSISPTTGPVGQVVTVTGTNLATVSQIAFNGAVTTANAGGSNTSFTVNVPTGATTGTLTVTTNGGSATSSQIFTVVPAPAISSFSPVRNALAVPLNTAVDISFTQPVTSTSATNVHIFSNQRGGLVANTTTVNSNKVLYQPTRYFKSGEVVSVTIPNTVQDSYGQAISNPQVYQFTTATKNGTGVFNVTPGIDPVVGTNPSNEVLADLDGDNKLDLAVVNYGANGTGNTVSVNRYTGGSGTPSLAPKVDFTLGPGQTGCYGIAAGDFDGDGKIDLVTSNVTNISVLRNTSTAPGAITASSFAASLAFTVGTNLGNVVVGDIDGDGKVDIIVTDLGGTTLDVLRNTTTGTTITFAAPLPFTVGTAPYSVAVGDIDNDGKLDLVAANSGGSTVSVLRNTTTGTTINFATSLPFTVGSTPVVVAVGDLSGDGSLDIVTVNNGTGSNSVSVLRNTTTGTAFSFNAAQTFPVGTLPAGLAIGDLNSDGKLDIVTANYGSNTTTGNGTTVSVLFNTSTSTAAIAMTAQPPVTVGTGPNSVALGDLDGDGDLDFVTANQGGANNTASVRINFTSAPPMPLPVTLTRFAADLAGRQVKVSWSTATELNNAYFEVERSGDGHGFASVGRVAANGNSTQLREYSLLDSPTKGKVFYYRLRQVDEDGTASYSGVRTVTMPEAAGSIVLVPNPAPANVTVDLTTAPALEYTVQISDLMGRLSSTQRVVGGQQVMLAESQNLKPGVYLITINGNSVNVTKRLVKQ